MSKSALDEVVLNGRRTRDHYIDAKFELAQLRATVAQQIERIAELEADRMTDEFNAAEGESFRVEYERQIREQAALSERRRCVGIAETLVRVMHKDFSLGASAVAQALLIAEPSLSAHPAQPANRR